MRSSPHSTQIALETRGATAASRKKLSIAARLLGAAALAVIMLPLWSTPAEATSIARLPEQLAHAKRASPHFARVLEGVDAAAVTSREALAKLPVTRKSDLHEMQNARLPFGGLNATPLSGLARIFVSPGPIYDPEGHAVDVTVIE